MEEIIFAWIFSL